MAFALIIISYHLFWANDSYQGGTAQYLIKLLPYQGLSCELPLHTTLKKAAIHPLLRGLHYFRSALDIVRILHESGHMDQDIAVPVSTTAFVVHR